MSLAPDRVDYLPMVDRPVIKWPNDARVALWISPNVEHYEYMPDNDGIRNPWPRTPFPDVQQYSYRDYGNRVGFWRMLEPLDKYGIKCCVSLNMAVLEHFPEIGEAMVQRDYDYMSHGIYNTRYLYTYDEDMEREFYRDTIDTLRLHTGKQLKGMLGPAISGSVRTPDLMAEAGLIYHTDWCPTPSSSTTPPCCGTTTMRGTISPASARPSSTNCTGRAPRAGGSCVLLCTRSSSDSPTGSSISTTS